MYCIVSTKYWNTDEVAAEIEAEHNQINGTTTSVTINQSNLK